MEYKEEKRIRTFQLSKDTVVKTISDVYDGELMDTEVQINGKYFCWIAGNSIEGFIEDLTKLMKGYRI